MTANCRVFLSPFRFVTSSCRAVRMHLGGVVLVVLILILPARPAAAQDTWQGTAGKWSVASNWTKGVPTGATPIIINSGNVEGDTSFTNQQALSIGTAALLNIDSTTTILNSGSESAINNSGALTVNGDLIFELGATLNNASTGELINNRLITMVNVSQFNNAGSIINTGGIDLGSTFNSTGSLDNFGSIQNSVTATIGGSFINQAGGTLTNFGTGQITIDSAITTLNNGTVTNLAGGQITIDSAAVNNGTITNFAGGQITTATGFSNTGTINNAGFLSGLIENSTTGTINNSGSATLLTLTNYGTVNNTGRLDSEALINNGALTNSGGTVGVIALINSGTFTNGAGASLAISGGGTFTNAGLINNSGMVQASSLSNAGTFNNAAGGTLAISNTLSNTGAINNNSGASLTIGVMVSNSGTINNDVGASLTVNLPFFQNSAGGTINNAGTLTSSFLDNYGSVSNTGLMNAQAFGFANEAGGTLKNSGEFQSANFTTFANSNVLNTGTITIAGNDTIPVVGGAFRNDGTVNLTAGPNIPAQMQVTGTGTLSGTGTINGNVFMQGIMAPGDSTGLFTINGSLTDTSSASFLEDINGAGPGQNGELKITGDVTLAGSLDVDLLNGFVPQADGSWVLLQYDGTLTGMFSGEVFPSDGLDWSVVYDTADHEVLLDVTGVESGGGGGTNVPEPGTGALLLSAVAMMLACSRFRKRAHAQGA
jgi:subtilase-type serine protease